MQVAFHPILHLIPSFRRAQQQAAAPGGGSSIVAAASGRAEHIERHVFIFVVYENQSVYGRSHEATVDHNILYQT